MHLIAMPSVYAGTFWLNMDDRAAPCSTDCEPGTVAASLVINVQELLSDRLLPLCRAAVHVSLLDPGASEMRQLGWVATDTHGDARLCWQMQGTPEDINIPFILSVRHYNQVSDLTSVFETAGVYTNNLQCIKRDSACCVVPAARAHNVSAGTFECVAKIVLVNRDTRTPGVCALR